MITELTNSVCSLMEEYQQEALKKQIEPDSARALAVDRVSRIRYGGEQKDYFWIIDKQPIPKGAFYYLRATTERTDFAWSSPIWVDIIDA